MKRSRDHLMKRSRDYSMKRSRDHLMKRSRDHLMKRSRVFEKYMVPVATIALALSMVTQKELSGGAVRPEAAQTIAHAEAIEDVAYPRSAADSQRILDQLKDLDIFLKTQRGIDYGNQSVVVTGKPVPKP